MCAVGAPSGTPDPIIRKVSKDMWTALNAPEVKDKYQANGAFIKFMSPEDTTKFVQDEQTTWRPILEQVAKAGRPLLIIAEEVEGAAAVRRAVGVARDDRGDGLERRAELFGHDLRKCGFDASPKIHMTM